MFEFVVAYVTEWHFCVIQILLRKQLFANVMFCRTYFYIMSAIDMVD